MTGSSFSVREQFFGKLMYPESRSRPFATDQELWSVVTDLQYRLKNLPSMEARPTLRITWSVGQGNWARVPWVSLLDTHVTDTTQHGIYGAFLFREDMSGVYLTLIQGVTEPKKTHGSTAGLQLLRENAAALRSQCGVPPNLFLFGLMNTADRSLAMVDYALRRRFAFYKLEPKFSSQKFRTYLLARGVQVSLVDAIVSRMTQLNNEITADKLRLGPGYQIGHSFFIPRDSAEPLDAGWYRRVIRSEIAPLLEEYWFDDIERAEDQATKLLDGLG